MLTWKRRNPKAQKRQVFPQKSLQPFKPQHMQHLFFIMSLQRISDIFLDSQSAMLFPLDPSQCIANLLSTLRCAKANRMQLFFVLGPVSP